MSRVHIGEPLPTAHTIRLRFDDTPENQWLYGALCASSDSEHRTPLPRQIKYLLSMAMGLRPADQKMLNRIHSANDLSELAASMPLPSARPATILRLIPGGAELMNVHYDVLVDDAEGRGLEHLDSFIFSKLKALRILREQRVRYPAAYLVKVVETRCREPKGRI